MSRSINFLAMLVLLITESAMAVAEIPAAPSCNDAGKAAVPCVDFVKGKNTGDSPSAACCAGVKDVASQAKSKSDQQAVCECLKGLLTTIGPYDPSRVALIPQKCGVDFYLPPITSNTDCSKYQSLPLP
ncbi:non-specific lipid-transfer protein 3-like [Durio zibethinus]|uniref:Non-specific lipid-transfer protein 3-like n=1 Tax=Durio zibethinus TaxID=66656 RepID=A0A6P5Y4U7_DURZI|nr:non-specific lipid-transfer protein 3-like [Durio zibethinus]